jgi:hypothetical protein
VDAHVLRQSIALLTDGAPKTGSPQYPGHVAVAVKHSEYFEGLFVRAVNDEVRIYRPEKHILASREIAALVTGMGMLGQPPAGIPYLAANPGGGLDTVAGDVGPQLLYVPASFRG